VLISQIVPVDANAQRFATDHATSLLAPSRGSDFDAYLARVMQRESTPGMIAQAADSYQNDPYSPPAPSENAYQAYRSDSARAEAQARIDGAGDADRATEAREADAAREKQDKNQVERRKADVDAADEAANAARDSHGSKAPYSPDHQESDTPERVNADAGASDGAIPQEEAEAQADATTPKKSEEEVANDSAAAAAAVAIPDAATKNRQATDATSDGAETVGAAQAARATERAESGEAGARPARGDAGSAKAREAGATVELEVNLDPASESAAEESDRAGEKERVGELAAKDAADEATTKASLRGRVPTREATAGAAAGDVVSRGEERQEGGEQRREQAKQAKIDVTDLRNKRTAERAAFEQTGSNKNRDQGGSHERPNGGENGARSFGDLIGGEGGRVGIGSTRTLANPTLSRAADQLSRQLNENLNSEIVRQAKFIVRTNDSGEIKLHLRPESLGSVRIALQMQDGHIAGRIIVDNQTVREVFEQNLAALERAFLEQGLESGGLDVTVADSGGHGREHGEATRERGATTGRGQTALASAVPTIENYETHEFVDVTV